MPRADRVRLGRRLAAFLSTALLAACGGGGGAAVPGGGGTNELLTGSVSGRITLVDPAPGIRAESEPNDTLDQAQDLGDLPAGARLSLVGRVDAAQDPLDGYRLRLPRRSLVSITVSQTGVSLDVHLYDPETMQVVGGITGLGSPRSLTLVARGAFDLVVDATAGAGPYEMTLLVELPPLYVQETEPNDLASEAPFLGTLGASETFELRGSASAVTDPSDQWLLEAGDATNLGFTFEFPAFTDFALRVWDVTADLASPVLLRTFTPPAGNVLTGELDLSAGQLVAFEIHASSGSGAWTLDVQAGPPSSSPKVLRVPGIRRLASLAVEARRLGTDPAKAYGRALGPLVPGEALVGYRAADADAASVAVEKAAGGGGEKPYPGVERVRFALPEGSDAAARVRYTLSEIRRLALASGVRYAEPNYVRRPLLVPDDPYYPLQWHYDTIHLEQAWGITTGSDDVVVAVVDTGRTDHPDLAGRQIGGYDMISDPWSARDGDGRDADPTDEGDLGLGTRSSFHGTHVAGTIGAATNNGLGVSGVTWHTGILNVRVLGRGGGTDYDVAQGIRWAAQLSNASGTVSPVKARVINMSLGGSAYSSTLDNACQDATDAGVLIVAAAGNESTYQPSYPAAFPSVMAVSAVDFARQHAGYSNYGSWIDIAAPGGDMLADLNADGYPDGVLSTIWYDDAPAGPGYTFYQGTSMAAPHVAGVAALCLAVDPTLTPGELRTILTSTADDLGVAGRDDLYGYGLVNAYRAVRIAAGLGPVPPQLVLSQTTLNFGSVATERDLALSNLGDAYLDVGAPTVTTAVGSGWLTASVLGPGDATRSADRIHVTVDRAGLPGGAYAGQVVVPSNGGTLPVDVVMRVESPLPPPDIDVVVQAIRVDTGEVVQTRTVNPTSSTTFLFTALPVGEYTLVAGTDLDHDGEIGEEGEYRGAWPVDGSPQTITVIESQSLENLDFPVTLRPALEAGG